LKERLDRILQDQNRHSRLERTDENLTRQLESLGYVGGSPTVNDEFDLDDIEQKYDPKDLIEFHTVMLNAIDLTRWKQYSAAKDLCQKLLGRWPDIAQPHFRLARIAMHQDDPIAAIGHYEDGLRLKDDEPTAHNNLAFLLSTQGRLEEAMDHFRRAVQLDPNYGDAHLNMAAALETLGELDQAVRHYRESLRIRPDHTEAHKRLAGALRSQGQFEQAIGHYRQVLQQQPDHLAVLNNLAWILASCPDAALRRPEEAIELAQRASETRQDREPGLLDTLAAAYAAAGRFDEARTTAQTALELATAAGSGPVADETRKHLNLYRQGTPYREAAKAPATRRVPVPGESPPTP